MRGKFTKVTQHLNIPQSSQTLLECASCDNKKEFVANSTHSLLQTPSNLLQILPHYQTGPPTKMLNVLYVWIFYEREIYGKYAAVTLVCALYCCRRWQKEGLKVQS